MKEKAREVVKLACDIEGISFWNIKQIMGLAVEEISKKQKSLLSAYSAKEGYQIANGFDSKTRESRQMQRELHT